jgi:hypothetical protein
MVRRGPKRQLDVESLYWQLILSGVGTGWACVDLNHGPLPYQGSALTD